MRRLEYDIYAPRAVAPPFRVLGSGGASYLAPTPTPSPPLAPEPYKVAPSSSASSRAHRRSSFVIIAETRPATPCSRSPSPTLATGRISPFRGRGFKGPLPRAQSRPQSPTNVDRRRHSRTERRASVSAQNSPKRSLIPQPTRRRSISLSKTETVRASPKHGRRAGSKTNLEPAANAAPGRKASLRPPLLSPIQGTPTKPPERKNAPPGRINLADKKSSPVKVRKNSLLPPRSVPKARRASGEKSPSKAAPDSPSKIPLKRGLTSGKTGSKAAQPARRGSTSKTTKPEEKAETSRSSVEKSERRSEKHGRNSAETPDVGSQKTAKSAKSGEKTVEETATSSKPEEDPGPSLMDLLKQSSGASGTSSMVNTTTVTAAQPLQIDAAILLENEASKEKISQTKPRPTDSAKKNAEAMPTGQESVPGQPGNYKNPIVNDSVTKSAQQSRGVAEDASMPTNQIKADLSVVQNPTPVKTGSSGQSTKTVARTNDAVEDSPKVDRSANVKSEAGAVDSRQATNDSNLKRNGTTNVQEQASAVLDQTDALKGVSLKTIARAGDDAVEGRRTGATVDSRNLVRPANGVNSAANGSEVNGATAVQSQDRELSLKSSTGVSTGSVGSVRSTDTGVSVNTARGVSSAREKSGMHLVKRPQQIETLSGNVAQIDRNGEPALLAPGREEEIQPPEKVGCWKKVVGRWCGCCSSMRCLACRRGSKNHPWPPKPTVPPAIDETPAGCWAKIKSSCRCWRWPPSKCCARGSRVAPAESGATCCPPERRCSALCRRLFSRCRCKRTDVQRARSIHAKQSLTSVAAPPVSEEPKSKLPEVLVEHNSLMRGAIPCLPVPLAWFCLVWNVLLPGSAHGKKPRKTRRTRRTLILNSNGTFWSGLFNLCVGQPRFSAVASARSRFGAFIVNLIVGVGQMFTVLFCLVGWGWSIWWGVTMVRLAKKYRRFKASETANGDVEARTAEPGSLPPGVPSQALRGIERAR